MAESKRIFRSGKWINVHITPASRSGLADHCWRGHLLSETRRRFKKGKSKGKSYCHECRKIYDADWSKANPERVKAMSDRANIRKNRGIDLWDFKYILHSQGGKCAICGSLEFGQGIRDLKRGAVDHDHKTGEVRGILCDKCNRGIGLLGDDIEILRSAIKYLSRKQSDLILSWRRSAAELRAKKA